jgi:hypothetical protein
VKLQVILAECMCGNCKLVLWVGGRGSIKNLESRQLALQLLGDV